ncbi:MAG: 50S ribosomal protein L1 [Elusimicrobia bacterium]|nr:50S ribosomal protein L1 [Elusimicrobiota bacterium]
MRSRRYTEIRKKVENRHYNIKEAVDKIKETATAKFDESVEIIVNLGVDTKKSDQMIRGNIDLPHGIGKEVKVAVAAEGSDVEAALKAGAVLAGKDKVIEAVNKGNIEFDVLIATPQCMKDLGKLGKVLGPKGLMPSPKAGTVVTKVAEAVQKVKKGQVEFKMDKSGVIHGIIGKVSFSSEKLVDNFNKYIDTIKKNRPASVKGKFILKTVLSSTMGPSINITV